ncbi:MAG: glycosyltransferase family 2 protein [Candidatus Thermoplasmatota archaeon]|nr:glycosyltransferase family 2 protein [Candidatus Thermoplasmatota archaeon]
MEKRLDGKISNFLDTSLVITTIKERRQYLVDLLQCILNQTIKPLEIIVVCDSKIKMPLEILGRYEALGIPIAFIEVSPELTLGETRNIGLRNTHNQYIFFLDDDTFPNSNWFVEMSKSLEKGADVVGGVSRPFFNKGFKEPIWWDEVLMGPYVAVGNQFLNFYDKIWGCNFAIRKDVVNKIGYFDKNLGMRRASPKLLAEDSEFVDRAVRSGLVVRFNSRAVVQHRLNADRINLLNFKKRAWQEGETFKKLNVKRKSYSTSEFIRVISLKYLRGFYFVIKRKSTVVALPIHMLLLVYELMGWLGINDSSTLSV